MVKGIVIIIELMLLWSMSKVTFNTKTRSMYNILVFLFVAVLFFAIFIVANGQFFKKENVPDKNNKVPSSELSVYKDQEKKFSFTYPSSWGEVLAVEPSGKGKNKTYYAKNLFGVLKEGSKLTFGSIDNAYVIQRKYNNSNMQLVISAGSPGCEGPRNVTSRFIDIYFELKNGYVNLSISGLSDKDNSILEESVIKSVKCGGSGNENITEVTKVANEFLKKMILAGQLDSESENNLQTALSIFESIKVD